MSTMAVASSLNPNAPLFIPAAYRQVEDFSPQWWELVKTTAWFRDHWFRQHQLHDAALALLPDDLLDMVGTDDNLFYAPDHHHHHAAKPAAYDLDVLCREVSLGSPRAVVGAAPSPRAQHQQQHRHAEKPAQHAGVRGAARRVIHQPR